VTLHKGFQTSGPVEVMRHPLEAVVVILGSEPCPFKTSPLPAAVSDGQFIKPLIEGKGELGLGG
jgi:hypothetical protein